MFNLRTRSFCRYRIHGSLPSPHGAAFAECLHARRFLPLLAGQERTFGWVTADNLLVTDFDPERVARGSYAAFALRVDRRRVNPRLLRAQLELEVGARLQAARDGGGPARLGRDERRQLREELHEEMLRVTNPSVDVHPVLVHAKDRVACVLSLSRTANELVQAHFRDTFDAQLVALNPWRRSVELLEDPQRGDRDLRSRLEDLRRSDFAAAPALTTREVIR
jgi:hypothetical protein